MPPRRIESGPAVNLSGLLPAVRGDDAYGAILRRLQDSGAKTAPLALAWGLLEASRPAVLASLQEDWRGTILVLAAQPERARFLCEQTSLWSADPSGLSYFPAPDALFYDRTPWDGETVRGRVTTLSGLASKQGPALVFTSVWALMTRTVPPEMLQAGIRTLRVGQTVRLAELVDHLIGYAYEPTGVVEQTGTLSRRGGILDVYPPNAAQPVRIEWLGDRIESMRFFDPVTQSSSEKVDSVILYPASEALPRLSPMATACFADVGQMGQDFAASRVQRDRERLERGEYFRGMEFYLPCLSPEPAHLFDFLPRNVLVIVDDLTGVEEAATALESQAQDLRSELLLGGQLFSEFPSPYVPWAQLRQAMASLSGFSLGYSLQDDASTARAYVEDRAIQPAPVYAGRIGQLVEDCARFRSEGQRLVVVSRQAQRLSTLLAEGGEHATGVADIRELPTPGSLTLVHGSIAEGWTVRGAEGGGAHRPLGSAPLLTVLADAELFGWARPKRRYFTRKKAASPESFFAELREGDYVVHIDHGIGIYRGLVRKTVRPEPGATAGSAQNEYLELEYGEGDRLYVPVSHIDRISRYVGSSDRIPSLHRLGTADWLTVRSRAKRAAQDIARELLALYAAREVVAGHAFAPDVAWQEDLEASFPYEETEDQLRAVAEVKADMEKPKPMDRLICGDVGYGKTEVAVRAAFKAVMDGKQVAVLVPTTVLAQQHLLTFQQRLAAFPVQVTMLSRFCSAHEQQETLRRLQDGTADIVIGTHRLIQKDVSFRDLGLLVVDEEQRFGVRHKEWLKQMRQQVDVLTLTATPIPRTLYMSLSAVRDMSTIDTPPEQRLPIRTQVAQYDEGLIRRAVLRELSRGGQVYFVHNRVQGIRQIAQRLQKVVPEASIAIGHGQMPEEALSRVMLDFAAGKYDVLVCTSIIESGLDIANVNTIIINRADRFGLAQLYQLRGRVGRSTSQAYAYLLHDKGQLLSDVARKRLEAILEASELGAGFRIAMRDLEIRGAGEILGAQQHGHIAAIGFELYCRLLSRAVQEVKTAEPGAEAATPEMELSPVIELPLEARLPVEYVPDEGLRLKLYQRLALLIELEQLDQVRRELEDRFGALPPPAEDLLYVLRVRLLAGRAGVQAIAHKNGSLVLKLGARTEGVARQVAASFGRRAWVARGQLWLSLRAASSSTPGGATPGWRGVLLTLLTQLAGGDRGATEDTPS